MKKKFSVNVDFTMAKTIEVEAENEEQAIDIADAMICENPYEYSFGFSHYVTHCVDSAEEVEED